MRFTVILVLATLGAGGLAGSGALQLTTGLVRRARYNHCQQLAKLVADRAADVSAHTPESLQELVASVVKGDEIIFASVLDQTGRSLATAQSQSAGSRLIITAGLTPDTPLGRPALVTPSDDRAAPYLDVTFPFERRIVDAAEQEDTELNQLGGYVRIGFSMAQTSASIQAFADLFSGITIIGVALIIPAAFWVVQVMIRPVHDLSATMMRFADGDLQARCEINRRDEIGELAVVYNRMADRLADKQNEINMLNSELEQRVAQRTRQLRELAVRDSLTGLFNRRHFDEMLEQRIAECVRYGHDLSCIMLDLDDFKTANDSFGHQRGDDLLVLAAISISNQLRSSDVAARYGGDEFVILLPQTDRASACVLGDRIRSQFQQQVSIQFPSCAGTLSVGVSSVRELVQTDARHLLRAADDALYKAKLGGKNRLIASAASS